MCQSHEWGEREKESSRKYLGDVALIIPDRMLIQLAPNLTKGGPHLSESFHFIKRRSVARFVTIGRKHLDFPIKNSTIVVKLMAPSLLFAKKEATLVKIQRAKAQKY